MSLALTNAEHQVMDLLWMYDKPLSCAEIVEASEDKTWKDSYVHAIIKSLSKKGLVKIEAFELISRSYARKFAPAMTEAEYIAYLALEEYQASPLYIIAALLDHIPNADDVTEVIKLAKERRKELILEEDEE